MGFQLVIAEGKEAGREFVFDQDSVLIGRTSDCDVVLYDPGVSRKHARIFGEGEAYYVEDMGSSNGTKVNGSIIKKQQLSEGDAISLGPVVFNFAPLSVEEPTDGGGTANQNTRILSVNDVQRKREALAPEDAKPEQLDELARRHTRAMAAVRRSSAGAAVREVDTRPRTPNPLQVQRQAAPLSAAERARIRRESGPLMAGLKIFWAEASLLTRRLVYAGFGVIGLGLVGLAYYLVLVSDDGKPPPPPEPAVLTRKPIDSSFGLGDGVTYVRPDMKIFEFEFNAPVKALAILHFQAKDISQGEVVVSVNGVDVGQVPPDTLAVNERQHEIIIPTENVRKGEKNTVIFDNTRNPPASDPWRIWNVWVEINLLPELPVDQLLRDAQVTFERAQQNFERRDVGAGNRYEAWKDFRTTWLMLEAHPEPKPELHLLAKDKMREAQQELDRTCAMLMLEAEGAYNQNNFEQARATLEHVKEYFPHFDQPCQWQAERKMAEYGL